MRLLLDTHICLWALGDTGRLPSAIVDAITDPANDVRVSAATAWEIAIKQSLQKLELPGPAEKWLPKAVKRTGFEWLDVTPADTLRVRALPWHHRDPFDRLLVAQAQGGLMLVSHDASLAQYDVALMTR